jgi:Ser/Thr protein kinase RdoA (MazF antagonist)
MTSHAEPGADVVRLLRDYDVGAPIDVRPLPGGSAEVLRVRTDRGAFVLKPAHNPAEIELQARVATYLNRRGIRQARVVPTTSGGVVSADRNCLQEFRPGAIVPRPTQPQTLAAMRHVGAYHRELARLPGTFTPDGESLWQRVADPDYLVRELPGLLAGYGDEPAVARALEVLDQARRRLADLPRQIVHGDIGPDNVLMEGSEVVAIVDFTPYRESALFASCTALYWYHVYGRTSVDVGQLRASVDAIGAEREWAAEELSLVPAGLVREALRRLATPLALAAEAGTPGPARAGTTTPGPSVAPRHAALVALLRALDSS